MSGLSGTFRKAHQIDETSDPIFNLPVVNYQFVGRSQELREGKSKFISKQRGRRLLVFGQSGLGKSAFSVALAEWAESQIAYDFAIWINCQSYELRGSRRLNASTSTKSVNDAVKEIAHYVRAEAALRATGTEAIAALNARCAGRSVLLIVDGIDDKYPEGLEGFFLGLGANFDVIATSSRNLGWPTYIELRPWEPLSEEANSFLSEVVSTHDYLLTPEQRSTALQTGMGVPNGIIWSARLLSEGFAPNMVRDLSSDGWSTLLDHSFEESFRSGIRSRSARSGAALFAFSGSIAIDEFDAITAVGEHKSLERPSKALIDSGFAQSVDGYLVHSPFAKEYLRYRMSNSKKTNSAIIDAWMSQINDHLSVATNEKSWGASFQVMEENLESALLAIRAYLENGTAGSQNFIDLFGRLSYFLYCNAFWDEFEEFQGRFIQECLEAGDVDQLTESSLVWGARLIRKRYGLRQSEEFFSEIIGRIRGKAELTEVQQQRIDIARRSVEYSRKFSDELATSFANSAERLLELGDAEWACRAKLHCGNVLAEAGDYTRASSAYKELGVIAIHSATDALGCWPSEMMALSNASLGILANRRNAFHEAADFLEESVSGILQTADRASAVGENALSYSKIGRRKEARKLLVECLELREQIGATESIMESHVGWEIGEGKDDLFTARGLERLNPWWK